MSMQACLPVPRKRTRKETSNASASRNNANLFDNIQAMDASEYLRRVVEQAEQIPEIMMVAASSQSAVDDSSRTSQADEWSHPSKINTKEKEVTSNGQHICDKSIIPIQGSAASLHYLVSHRTALQPPPTARHAASRAWVDHVLENFSRLRSYLDTCIDEKGVGQERQHPLPALKDRPGWLVFCIGQDEADGNVGSYFDDSDEYDSDVDAEDKTEEKEETAAVTTSSTATRTATTTQLVEQQQKTGDGDTSHQEDNIPLWKQNLPSTGYNPNVDLVGQMDQVMIRRVLGHLIHYITKGWSLQSKALTCWMYALLARLARPLHRDEACLLYQLLKQMTQDRSKIDTVDLIYSNTNGETTRYGTELMHLNLLISIVGIYFEQGGGYDAVMRFPGSTVDGK